MSWWRIPDLAVAVIKGKISFKGSKKGYHWKWHFEANYIRRLKSSLAKPLAKLLSI